MGVSTGDTTKEFVARLHTTAAMTEGATHSSCLLAQLVSTTVSRCRLHSVGVDRTQQRVESRCKRIAFRQLST